MTRCTRCQRTSAECNVEEFATWDICALDNRKHLLCPECDVMLNELVLWFFQTRNRQSIIRKYRRKTLKGVRR